MREGGGFAQVMQYIARFFLFVEYFLTGGLRSALGIAIYTVVLWLYLTEYYLAERFPWWQGQWEYFFLIPVLALPAGLSAYGVWCLEKNRPTLSPMAFDDRDEDRMAAPVAVWIAMLREAADHSQRWLLTSFLRWEARLMTRYGAGRPPLSFTELPSVWRRSLRHKLAVLWFPLFLAYLVSPAPLRVMETMATILSDKPPEIGSITASRLGGTKVILEKRSDPGAFYFHSPANFPQGRLTLSISDFPRVYRRVQAVCAGAIPGCFVAPSPLPDGGVVAVQSVRGGKAEFEFARTTASLDLQMVITVFQRDGATVLSEDIVH